jgi:eukaryotic-like serine/threonine-protein kinase
MSLSPGTKLGMYEIVAPLGADAMGEVYRARDSRLNRDVAIRMLPPAFANDGRRMARFRHQVQMLAALDHRNIAAIYGIEHSAVVMELVEGQTLDEHIAIGPVPLEEALAVVRQIADALDAAHQKNIIYRDLKPSNVKITPEGGVKLLDFGLAKAFRGGPASADPAHPPKNSKGSEQPDAIPWMSGYMSPEQARGKPVDKRADIWSFGVVFYELLTGERAFAGETIYDTLAAVLRADIDWSRLPVSTPYGVRRLLQRCLERDLNKRLRDIGDVWNDMDRRVESKNPVESKVPDRSVEPKLPSTPPPAKQRWIPWAVAAAAIVVAAAATGEWSLVPSMRQRPVTRHAMIIADGAESPALSRDGTRLVYMESSGTGRLWLRMMDQLEGKPIPGTEGGVAPVFSPDGKWIAYISLASSLTSPRKLKKIPVAGGKSIALCDAPTASGISWDVDDTILLGSSKGLMRVPAAGGSPQPLTAIDRDSGEGAHTNPEFLPGGQSILFTIWADSADSSRLAVLDLKTGAYRVVVNGGYAGRYVPTGYLVYKRGGTLLALPFDLKRLAVSGSETPVVEGIYSSDYTFSDSSLLVFRAGQRGISSTLEWADRKGVRRTLSEPPHSWVAFALSPDGKRLVGEIADGASGAESKSDLWIYDLERGTMAPLTFGGSNSSPVWTPDGKWVIYHSFRDRKHGIYRVAANVAASKAGQPELLSATDGYAYPTSWTADGKILLFHEYIGSEYKSQIWMLPVGGVKRKPQFTGTSFSERSAQISPDGRWMAYLSDESGKFEVYVAQFPGPGGHVRISTAGGSSPRWSRTGRELFYVERGELMAVDIAAGPAFRAGHPQALFKLDSNAWFDVSPEPMRFLIERFEEKSNATTFVTVTDWFDDLRRRAAAKQ